MTSEKVMSTLNGIAGTDPKVWIAGSAAICPQLAEDIDLWVMAKSALKPEAFDLNIWTEMPLMGDEYTDAIPNITKRLEVTVPSLGAEPPLKVQVMFTQFKQPWQLLDYFDMSCHLYARNIEDILVVHKDATLPGSPIKLTGANNSLLAKEDGCPCPSCKVHDYHQQRIEEFTTRYANTTRDMLWLPS